MKQPWAYSSPHPAHPTSLSLSFLHLSAPFRTLGTSTSGSKSRRDTTQSGVDSPDSLSIPLFHFCPSYVDEPSLPQNLSPKVSQSYSAGKVSSKGRHTCYSILMTHEPEVSLQFRTVSEGSLLPHALLKSKGYRDWHPCARMTYQSVKHFIFKN